MNVLDLIKRVFLLIMSLVYMPIGLWALLDPIRNPFPFSLGSFEEAIGLDVVSAIGFSEIAGLYGGVNLVLGLMMGLGMFHRSVANLSIMILTFLTGSMALGRFLGSLLPDTPGFLNAFFIFECVVFGFGFYFVYQSRLLSDIIASKK